jgi:uncharacterized membrane protein
MDKVQKPSDFEVNAVYALKVHSLEWLTPRIGTMQSQQITHIYTYIYINLYFSLAYLKSYELPLYWDCDIHV